MRKPIMAESQASEKGRREGEQGGKRETGHEAKITELKKKIFSQVDYSAGRDFVEPGKMRC
jgi:hypothetical protein